MKTFKLLAFGLFLLLAGSVQGQVSINVHLGTPPQWGPAGHSEARYYYLPDVESYYDVQTSRFIYFDGRTWVHRANLPARYRNYDLYNGYKVVMSDYRGNRPYSNFKSHKMKYARGYRGQEQHNIGVRPGNRGDNNRFDNNSSKNDRNQGNKKDNKRNEKENRGNDRGNNDKHGRD
jgi:hypothetical protein